MIQRMLAKKSRGPERDLFSDSGENPAP